MKTLKHIPGLPVSALLLFVACLLADSFGHAADNGSKVKTSTVRKTVAGVVDPTKAKVEDRTTVSVTRILLIESRLDTLEKQVKSLQSRNGMLTRENGALQKEIEGLKEANSKQDNQINAVLLPGAAKGRTSMWITFGGLKSMNASLQDSTLLHVWADPRAR